MGLDQIPQLGDRTQVLEILDTTTAVRVNLANGGSQDFHRTG
jgi:hypothetical protein